MKVIKRDMNDYWAPTASLMAARLVLSHSLTFGRVPKTVDLTTAYLQVPLLDEAPHFFSVT